MTIALHWTLKRKSIYSAWRVFKTGKCYTNQKKMAKMCFRQYRVISEALKKTEKNNHVSKSIYSHLEHFLRFFFWRARARPHNPHWISQNKRWVWHSCDSHFARGARLRRLERGMYCQHADWCRYGGVGDAADSTQPISLIHHLAVRLRGVKCSSAASLIQASNNYLHKIVFLLRVCLWCFLHRRWEPQTPWSWSQPLAGARGPTAGQLAPAAILGSNRSPRRQSVWLCVNSKVV